MMKKNLRIVSVCLLVVTAAFVAGCSPNNNSEKTIVTSFYPLEFVVREIVGDDYTVTNVTPAGAEPHDLELSPQTTESILSADLAFVMGSGFQPAVETTALARDGKTVKILDSILSESPDGVDPHVWLDPILYKGVVTEMTKNLVALNHDHKKMYEQRRDNLLNRLDELDTLYSEAFNQCETTTFITSHEAFSRLAQRYGLTSEAIAGISPDNEPSPEKLSQLAELSRRENVEVIFTEDLVSDRVAKALSTEAGVTTEVLSPIEGLTQQQIDDNLDYFDVMKSNLKKLTGALRCAPA